MMKGNNMDSNLKLMRNQKEIELLLVEDNAHDAELAMRALKDKNRVVNKLTWVKDGEEALDYIFAKGKYSGNKGNASPKVILCDLKMPKVSGIEVLEKLKGDPKTKNIPVVMLTSSNRDIDIDRCYELGANSYIVKPVGFENFRKAVKDIGLYWLLLNETN